MNDGAEAICSPARASPTVIDDNRVAPHINILAESNSSTSRFKDNVFRAAVFQL